MRPRKDVLVYCANEYELDLFAYVLSVKKYIAVRPVKDLQELRVELDAAIERDRMGCVVVLRSKDEPEASRLPVIAKWLPWEMPVLELVDGTSDPLIPSGVSMPSKAPMAEILDRIFTLSARKRGPNKNQKARLQLMRAAA